MLAAPNRRHKPSVKETCMPRSPPFDETMHTPYVLSQRTMHAPVYSISFLRDVAHKSRWDKPLRLTGTTEAKNVLELLLRPPARRPPEHRPGMPRRPAPECAPNNTLKRSPSQQYAQKTICLRTVLEQMCRMYGTHSPCDIARPLCPEVIRRPPEVDALSMPHDSIIARPGISK